MGKTVSNVDSTYRASDDSQVPYINSISQVFELSQYYRVIALISVNIVPSWDIEGRELASVRSYPNEGQYSLISAR